MRLTIPDFCLVMLVGGPAKASRDLAARLFAPEELVAGEPATAERDARIRDRLVRRLPVVVAAPNVHREARVALVALAHEHHAAPIAIVVEPGPIDLAALSPADHDTVTALHGGLGRLEREGVRRVHTLSPADQATLDIVRERLPVDRRDVAGPFDIIGDVHGCCDELEELLARLGYVVRWQGEAGRRSVEITPPAGRRAILVGDLVDRGPRTPDVLRISMALLATGRGFVVLGNHDDKLRRLLEGHNVAVSTGLRRSIEQLAAEPPGFTARVQDFIAAMPEHLWLDGGRLAVAHGGIQAGMIGRMSSVVRRHCLFGDTTGETGPDGYPVRRDWAIHYEGPAAVVYGHTVVDAARWINNTICIDTGACFGGRLTALRWPERELVSVPARAVYMRQSRHDSERRGP